MAKPLVAVVMGSISDLPVMGEAERVLKELDIPYEVSIISAHRTPERTAEFAKTARERGIKVIIAGAGGSAHLAGVMAAYTSLPIIAVPIAATPLAGFDALLSMVQMPPGVPVATMAINGAANAAILSAQILALEDKGIEARLTAYQVRQREKRVKKIPPRRGGKR